MATLDQTKEIRTLYAGVFKVPIHDGFFETFLCGFSENGQNMVAHATIEHEARALPSLVRLCKQIESDKGLSWRLLKFDQEGVEELDKSLYEEYLAWMDTRPLI
ncbi:MAG: hypothetical protein SWE60_21730 [Thermodesulfobacteriota bacterium]|nr:hypothetical protein [Thermodesulfobacteriota bacterium]